jgi:hypothetical protein
MVKAFGSFLAINGDAVMKLVALAIGAALCVNASAALVSSTGFIASLRVEGSYGFIGLSQPWASSSTCGGGRVWVDMTTPLGRSVYATAMLAFSSRQTVTIRAFEEHPIVFGACTIYDIYVTQ